MSASDVHAELSANAAHYDAFCGVRSTDARASALDRRGVADVLEALAASPSHPPSPAPSLRGPHAYAMEQARLDQTQMDEDYLLALELQFGGDDDSQQPAADYGGGGPPGAAARGGEAAGSRAPRDLGAAFATASPPLPSALPPSAREVIDLTADDPPSAPAVDGGSPAEGESNRKRPRTGL
jgi:hypothetical protein